MRSRRPNRWTPPLPDGPLSPFDFPLEGRGTFQCLSMPIIAACCGPHPLRPEGPQDSLSPGLVLSSLPALDCPHQLPVLRGTPQILSLATKAPASIPCPRLPCHPFRVALPLFIFLRLSQLATLPTAHLPQEASLPAWSPVRGALGTTKPLQPVGGAPKVAGSCWG